MAQQIYLISKDNPEDLDQLVDGVHAMVLNADDGDSDTVKKTEAATVCRAQGVQVEDDYFDTVRLLGPPTAGVFEDNGDAIIFRPDQLILVQAD